LRFNTADYFSKCAGLRRVSCTISIVTMWKKHSICAAGLACVALLAFGQDDKVARGKYLL